MGKLKRLKNKKKVVKPKSTQLVHMSVKKGRPAKGIQFLETRAAARQSLRWTSRHTLVPDWIEKLIGKEKPPGTPRSGDALRVSKWRLERGKNWFGKCTESYARCMFKGLCAGAARVKKGKDRWFQNMTQLK